MRTNKDLNFFSVTRFFIQENQETIEEMLREHKGFDGGYEDEKAARNDIERLALKNAKLVRIEIPVDLSVSKIWINNKRVL